MLALRLRHAVDVLDVAADGKDALPAGDGVRPHDGVDGLELRSDVLWVAAGLIIELEAVFSSRLPEARLLKGDAEALEELLVGAAQLVVYFVPRGPSSVCGS